MQRRSSSHDYTAAGFYHLTMSVDKKQGQALGRVTEHRCLPVICHRRDAQRRAEQKVRCLEEAAKGTVLVSARIAKGEQEIMDEAVNRGFAVIVIADNGFTDRYHPSQKRIDLCAAGRLLLVSPWQYHYRPKSEGIGIVECKTMNCVAQALCRTRDTWWQHSALQCPPVSAPTAPPGSAPHCVRQFRWRKSKQAIAEVTMT